MTALELRKILESLLSPELGKYSSGIPSIWVYGSAQNPPSASDGLECLIRQMPLGVAQASSGGQIYKPQQWEITLKNFKEDSSLIKAKDKIECRFSIITFNHIPANDEVHERARILIFDPTFVNY